MTIRIPRKLLTLAREAIDDSASVTLDLCADGWTAKAYSHRSDVFVLLAGIPKRDDAMRTLGRMLAAMKTPASECDSVRRINGYVRAIKSAMLDLDDYEKAHAIEDMMHAYALRLIANDPVGAAEARAIARAALGSEGFNFLRRCA